MALPTICPSTETFTDATGLTSVASAAQPRTLRVPPWTTSSLPASLKTDSVTPNRPDAGSAAPAVRGRPNQTKAATINFQFTDLFASAGGPEHGREFSAASPHRSLPNAFGSFI